MRRSTWGRLFCCWPLLSAPASWSAPAAQPAPSSERDAELRKRLLLLIESLDICDSDWSRQDERLLSTLSLTEKLKLSQDLLAATTESGQLRSSLSTASSSLAQMRGLLRRDRLRTALIAGGVGLAVGILVGLLLAQ